MNSVQKAILAITDDLAKEGISKDRKNQQQGFNFRGIEDVYGALAPKMALHGLTIIPQVQDVTDFPVRSTKSGGSLYGCRVKVKYLLVGEDGSVLESLMYGEGADQGDKATSKALSMAFKYFAFQTFCIPVDGTDDADRESPEPSKPATQPPRGRQSTIEPFADPGEAADAIASCKTPQGLTEVVAPRIRVSTFSDEELAELRKAMAKRMVDLKGDTN